jgi:hypothetical protein
MNKLLILGLIIILIISLIYKVYKRKTIEGNQNCELSSKEQLEKEIIKNDWNYIPNLAKDVMNFHNEQKHCKLSDREKLENANKDNKIAQEFDITTDLYYEKYTDDFTMDRKKAAKLAEELGKRRKNKIQIVKNEVENTYKEYTKDDFVNVKCSTCDDIKEEQGLGCALYYEPEKEDDSKLTIYYKNFPEATTYRVSDDNEEIEITNQGDLIKKSSKCKEIKSLEKCKNVNNCEDIIGSVPNRENCVVCEEPISNGTYEIDDTWPDEDKKKKILGTIKVQHGFPKDWKRKGYECKQDFGPFDVEGCKRGACAEDYNPPGPNSADCYAELYVSNGGVGPPREPIWWTDNATNPKPIKFNGYVEESGNNEYTWNNPDDGNFQSIVATISSKTNEKKKNYKSAKRAYVFKNGPVDENEIQEFACTHQAETGKPNIDCHLKEESGVGLQPDAYGSFYERNYNIKEIFSNLREGYTCTNTQTYINSELNSKIKIYLNSFIKDLSSNFSTTKYGEELQNKADIKNLGRGDKKQAALQVFGKDINNDKPKKGDHVQFSLNNKTVKGVIVEIENKKINNIDLPMALCIWDYYKDSNNEYYRKGYSVCNEEKFVSEYPNIIYNNSDCIDGVTSYFDMGTTNCSNGNLSCGLINNTTYESNLGSYKSMKGSLMEKMLDNSKDFSSDEKKLWKDEGWIDIIELERLHICQGEICEKGYFSCGNTVNNYINL